MSKSFPTIALIAGLFILSNIAVQAEPHDNVVISAHRTSATIDQVGSTVSTIDRQIIDNRQTIFITDLLQDLPGIAVSRSGNFGAQTAIRLRGAEANHVLVRIDGIEVNDPAADDAFAFEHLTANDIERIEVVRGPQSAVWGSDALAGVINITTRHTTDRLSSDIFVTGGAFDTYSGGLHVGTRNANSGIDLTASWLDSDGTNISRFGTEDDGYRNLTTNLRTDIDVTHNLRLDASLRHVDTTKQFDDIDYFSTGLPVDADRETDTTQSTFGASGHLTLFDSSWEQSLRLTIMTTDNEDFIDGIKDTTTAADKFGVYYQSTFNFDHGPTDESKQHFTIAIDFEDEEFEQRGTAAPWGDPNQDQDMHTTGIVGEYRLTDIGGLSLSLGIRHDNNNAFDSITTYRTTAAYHFDKPDSRLHASFGTGQKSPTFTDRFGIIPDQFQGNPDLEPEQSRGFDFGYEQHFFGGQIIADLTYFNRHLKDEINGFFFDPAIGAFGMSTAVNRDGTSKSKGIEVETSLRFENGLSAAASYTYTDANQPDATGQKQREIRRARHMAMLNLGYKFLSRAQINANLSYTGEQTDTFFAPFPAPSETVSLDAYTLANLSGQLTITDSITIFARIENLFDTTYENVYGFATPGVGGFIGARIRFAH